MGSPAKEPGLTLPSRRTLRRKAGFKGFIGAGNGVRTRDIQLGKLTLYQLSYARSGRAEYSERAAARQRSGSVRPLDKPGGVG